MGKNFKSISKENKDVCEFRNWDNWYRLNWFNFSSEQNLQDRYFCFDLFLSEQTLNFYNLRSFLFFWLKKDSNFCQVWESVIFTFLFCTACQVKVKDQSKSMQILYKSYIWPSPWKALGIGLIFYSSYKAGNLIARLSDFDWFHDTPFHDELSLKTNFLVFAGHWPRPRKKCKGFAKNRCGKSWWTVSHRPSIGDALCC